MRVFRRPLARRRGAAAFGLLEKRLEVLRARRLGPGEVDLRALARREDDDLLFRPRPRDVEAAFAAGGQAAFADYADAAKLAETWREAVLTEAALSAADLSSEETAWLDKALETEIENLRLDARGVQRALAARLQRQWIENPAALKDVTDAGALADALKAKSLKLVTDEIGSEVLP